MSTLLSNPLVMRLLDMYIFYADCPRELSATNERSFRSPNFSPPATLDNRLFYSPVLLLDSTMTDPMSSSFSPVRRGTSKHRTRIASCEPCRLSKLACDHRRPACSRCVTREIDNQCVYRKNPFKRNRPMVISEQQSR